MCGHCWIQDTINQYKAFTLRGLCARTSFDTWYTVVTDQAGQVGYKGRQRTLITYSLERRRWEMSLVNSPARKGAFAHSSNARWSPWL